MKVHAHLLFVACLLAPAVAAWAQTRQPAEAMYTGRVTGDRVYVRSGPDVNYYALGKVNRGQIVRVLGQQFGWLKIEPLPGMYSLIEENYLDLTASGRGIVNADRVNVRAGADSTPHVYARQTRLDRGAEVRVLGRREAKLAGQTLSFYKIEPPPGAHVWISADYVEGTTAEPEQAAPRAGVPAPIGGAAAPTAGAAPPTPGATEAQPAAGDAESAARPPAEEGRVTAASEAPPAPGPLPAVAGARGSEELRRRLAAIDDDLKAEFDKPLTERSFGPLREALAPLATQESDEVVRRYAEIRLEQIEHQVRMIETIRSLREETRSLDDYRREAMQARAEIRVTRIETERGFELAGELRESHVYNTPALPRRYRLVDPGRTPARTLAYIEIPREADLDPLPLLGRYVGITVASRTYHKGLVEAVPIVVPAEIVVIDRPATPMDDSGEGASETASQSDPSERSADQPEADQ